MKNILPSRPLVGNFVLPAQSLGPLSGGMAPWPGTVDLSGGHNLASFALTTLSIDDARNEGRNKQMKRTTTRRTHAVSALTLAGLTLAAAMAGSANAGPAHMRAPRGRGVATSTGAAGPTRIAT